MSRRELREHIFRMLFRKEFFASEEEFEAQTALYMEELEPLEEKDRRYMQTKVADIYAKVPELDEKLRHETFDGKTFFTR